MRAITLSIVLGFLSLLAPAALAAPVAFDVRSARGGDWSDRRTWEDDIAAERLPLLLRNAWAARQQCVYIRVERSRNLEDLL